MLSYDIANILFVLFTASVVICDNRLYNVVLIVADDLRPAIRSYGDPLAITPNLDKFIEKSSYFTRAYSQQALCAPSRNSMLTGRRPDTLHLYDFYSYWRTFAGNFTTLPQYFKDNGYHTYSIGKIFHPGVSSNFTDDYPLSWSSPSFHSSTEKYMNKPVCPDGEGVSANLVCPVDTLFQPEKTLPDIQSVQEAKRYLADHSKNKMEPFFLAVGFHKPHIPFRFPKEYLELHPRYKFLNDTNFRRYGIPTVAWNPYTDIRKRDDAKKIDIPFPYGPIDKDFATSIKQAYYASVSYMDSLFGELMSSIDLNDTIVIFTSDHGWSLGEHGEWAKYSNFDVALRVPLVIYTPANSPKRIDDIVELVDILPTVVDLANLNSVPSCLKPSNEILCTEGKSLLPILQGHPSESMKPGFSQYPRPGALPTNKPNSDKPRLKQIRIMGYAIRTLEFRYTLWVRFHRKKFKPDWKKVYGEELYDHRFDGAEDMNLVDRPELDNVRCLLRNQLIAHFSGVSELQERLPLNFVDDKRVFLLNTQQ